MGTWSRMLGAIYLLTVIAGCQGHQPIPTVPSVDLKRFTGDWNVIARVPTAFEKNAFNALGSYRLDPGGSVTTTFT